MNEIENALMKKALGYTVDEVVEEYVKDESGEMTVTKMKVTKKHYPPDLSALKTCLGLSDDDDLSQMSEQELIAERKKLLNELKKENENGNLQT